MGDTANDDENNKNNNAANFSSIFPDIWGEKSQKTTTATAQKAKEKNNVKKIPAVTSQSINPDNGDDDDDRNHHHPDSGASTGDVFHECKEEYHEHDDGKNNQMIVGGGLKKGNSNPFDDDDDDKNDHDSKKISATTTITPSKRVANLSFSLKPEENVSPALKFVSSGSTGKNILSPLEKTMKSMKYVSSPSNDDDNDDDAEDNEDDNLADNVEQNNDDDDDDNLQRQLQEEGHEYDIKVGKTKEERVDIIRTSSESSFLSAKSTHDDDGDDDIHVYHNNENSPLLQKEPMSSSNSTKSPKGYDTSQESRYENTDASKSPKIRFIKKSRRGKGGALEQKKAQQQKQKQRNFLLQDTDHHTDENNQNNPWSNKMIILEELGTATSWFILLLPYISFLVAILLDWDYGAPSSSDSLRHGWWSSSGGSAGLENVLIGPLLGNASCHGDTGGFLDEMDDQSSSLVYDTFPLMPIPSHPCSYAYQVRDDAKNRDDIEDVSIIPEIGHGVAFTSGLITSAPPAVSTYLRGDVTFSNLSNEIVKFVSEGKVATSVVLFQSSQRQQEQQEVKEETQETRSSSVRRRTLPNPATPRAMQEDDEKEFENTKEHEEDGKEEWTPIHISKPSRLDMVCYPRDRSNSIASISPQNHSSSQAEIEEEKEGRIWNCNTPRIIDILFSLPDTGVLTGGNIRIDVLFSYHSGESEDRGFFPFSNARENYYVDEEVQQQQLSSSNAEEIRNLSEISSSSSFRMQHESSTYAAIDIWVRFTTLVISFVFLCFWVTSMRSGSSRNSTSGTSCCSCSSFFLCCCKAKEEKRSVLWWESPWILFPERRYLLLLLVCLLFLQNPLFVYSFFRPKIYSNPKMHAAADSVAGIGVHGILFFWLCLMEGLRYHTADIARKRADHQRNAMQLRHAARYVSERNVDTRVTHYAASYYDTYGDVDGTAGTLNKLLYHDPCGDSAVDFLLPKLFLFAIGISSVIIAAIFRFPASIGVVYDDECSCFSSAASLSSYRLDRYSTIYIVSSFTQLSVLLIWVLLIVHASFVTGSRLRKEPFLSTRPAQLAFRILVGILSLGIVAFLLPFLVELFGRLVEWTYIGNNNSEDDHDFVYYTSSGYHSSSGKESALQSAKRNVFLRLLIRAGQRFPYSGTAASLRPGEVVYATVTSLIAAFIFLPASSFYQSDSNDLVDNSMRRTAIRSIIFDPPDRSQIDVELCTHKKDKRIVIALARHSHTWRIFPLPMERKAVINRLQPIPQLITLDTFQLSSTNNHQCKHPSKYGRGMIYQGRYIPVFCTELACWLLECSWQAYYSPEYSIANSARMNLDNVGLKLEGYFFDESTDTHAYVASNVSEQVDGEEDSIIVVSFRGSTSYTNMKTDLSMKQVPLPEMLTREKPAFQIRSDDIEVEEGGKIRPSSLPFSDLNEVPNEESQHGGEDSPLLGLPKVSLGARNILRAIPVARQALPCVHAGFHEAYFSVRDQVMESIVKVYQRQFDKTIKNSRDSFNEGGEGDDRLPLVLPKIYVTGHSLGGCLGQLLALDLATNCEIVLEQSISSCDPSNKHSIRATIMGLFDAPPSENNVEANDSAVASESNIASTPQMKNATSSLEDKESELVTPKRARISLMDFFSPSDEKKAQKRTKHIQLQLPLAVYTYGSPRVGNRTFARLYKQRVPHTFRVVNEGDALTMLPIPLVCGGNYKHAGLNVMLDEGCTGNTLVGPTIVETLFRFSKVRTSVAAHMMNKYRECLESALTQDELQEYYIGHGGVHGHGSDKKGYLPEWVTKRNI